LKVTTKMPVQNCYTAAYRSRSHISCW